MAPPAVLHAVPDDDLVQHDQSEACPCGTTRRPLDSTTGPDGYRAFVITHARLDDGWSP